VPNRNPGVPGRRGYRRKAATVGTHLKMRAPCRSPVMSSEVTTRGEARTGSAQWRKQETREPRAWTNTALLAKQSVGEAEGWANARKGGGEGRRSDLCMRRGTLWARDDRCQATGTHAVQLETRGRQVSANERQKAAGKNTHPEKTRGHPWRTRESERSRPRRKRPPQRAWGNQQGKG